MSSPLDIGAYLARVAQGGEADGQGEFTISHQQAARKLARFSLPRSSAWVAKLIQVAVRWQARSVEVRHSLNETFLHLELDTVPTEEAIISAIVSGAIDRGKPLEGLALALRAIVEQAGLSFLLVSDDGQSTPRPIYAGRYFSRLSERARLAPRFHPRPGLSLTVRHRPAQTDYSDPDEVLAALRGHLPLLDELRRTCFVCPLPILCQEGQHDGLLASPELGGSSTKLMLLRGLRGLASSPDQLVLPGDFEDKAPSLLSHPLRVRRSYGGSRLAQAVLMLGVRLDPPRREGELRRCSRLLWVNDGVVVQEEKLALLATEVLQMTVLANASGLATDLTGFSLIGNDEFHQRREEVLRAAGRVLGEPNLTDNLFGNDSDELSASDDHYERRKVLPHRLYRSMRVPSFWPRLPLPGTVAAAMGVPAGLLKLVFGRELWSLEKESSRADLLAAILADLGRAIELLTGEKPPPPPGRTVQFVSRRQ